MQGVFINPAFIEPFGLTLIEVCVLKLSGPLYDIFPIFFFSFFRNKYNFCSFIVQAAAHGLPIVATKNGGPVDIHQVCLLIGHKELIEGSTCIVH